MPRIQANENDKLLGIKIKSLRNHIGLPQKWLGEKLGVSIQQIQKYEKGVNKISARNLELLAKTFNKPLSYFSNENESERLENTIIDDPRLLKIFYNLIKLKNVNYQETVNDLIKSLIKLG